MNIVEFLLGVKKLGGFVLWVVCLQMVYGCKLVIVLFYLWLILLFMLLFLIVFKISFVEMVWVIFFYIELMEWVDGQLMLMFNFVNFLQLIDDLFYFEVYFQLLQVVGILMICCLLLGYLLVWVVVYSKLLMCNILLLLVIFLLWILFLICVYVWMGLLKSNGVLNNFLLWLGVIDQLLEILYINLVVYIGIVYVYLLFMVLFIYIVLICIDYLLVEVLLDFGVWLLKIFFQVIVLFIKGGIIVGFMLVFILVVGEFVILELLGGLDSIMIGCVLWQEFFNNCDWLVVLVVVIVMLLLLIVLIMWFYKYQ